MHTPVNDLVNLNEIFIYYVFTSFSNAFESKQDYSLYMLCVHVCVRVCGRTETAELSAMSMYAPVDVHVCMCMHVRANRAELSGLEHMCACVDTHARVRGKPGTHAHRNPYPSYSKEMRSKIWVCWLSPSLPQTRTC